MTCATMSEIRGINLVAKGVAGGGGAPSAFGQWTRDDLARLADMGFNALRLGVNWAASEPEPGRYDDEYLDWVGSQLDAARDAGLVVVLDAHQDLYSQRWANGAPDWATLTDRPFEATELWSDAYLTSPAVHEALDAFWANAPDRDGVGLQERFADWWGELASRFAAHPAVIGYDVLNEPTPGAASAQIFGSVIGAFAEMTGQPIESVLADFDDPGAKLAQLARLDDEAVHRAVGDAAAPLSARFEQTIDALYRRVLPRVRAHDTTGWVLREHNYFGNIGVPAGVPPLPDDRWVYSPHGYDLTVDTPAVPLSSNTRAGTIFARAAETAERLGVDVVVGEWGAFDTHTGVRDHAQFLLDTFNDYGWGWFYWCWTPEFAGSETASVLGRHLSGRAG